VPDSSLFLAGDVRANENIELTALQTVFMREHNRIASNLASKNPTWTDEQIYQAARRIVIGEVQAITYNEFLPALLGAKALRPYCGYNPRVNPGIATEFSTAAFRFGHSMLDGDIERMNNDGTSTPQGSVALRDAFFNPTLLDPTLPDHQGDVDPILKGAASSNAQEIDVQVVDDVRNFLFGPPGSGGFDLASLNIQRGRDHGLPDYNTLRQAYGLPRVTSFAQITSDPSLQKALSTTYASVTTSMPGSAASPKTTPPAPASGRFSSALLPTNSPGCAMVIASFLNELSPAPSFARSSTRRWRASLSETPRSPASTPTCSITVHPRRRPCPPNRLLPRLRLLPARVHLPRFNPNRAR